MKRVLFLLILASAVSLAIGCGDTDNNDTSADSGAGDSGAESACAWSYTIDENDPDVISGASGTFTYESRPGFPGQLVYSVSEMAEVLSLVSDNKDRTEQEEDLARSVQFVISTVQCDGSPNISNLFPAIVNDEVVLLTNRVSLTRDSILATKYARTYFRVWDTLGANYFDDIGSGGNRMLLKLIEDEEERQRLYEEFIDNSPTYDYADLSLKSCIFMRVVALYPMG